MRLTAEWQADYDAWQKRDLSARRYVYVWADGVYLQARMEENAECMLVLIGATTEGKKKLVGFQTGVRESAQSWGELLIDIRRRGLEVEIALAGQLYRQVFARGIPKSGLEKLGRTPNRRGTKVRLKPDPQIFGDKAKFNPQRLFKMARAKAYLFGGVEIRWHCDKALLHGIEGVPEDETFHFPDGLKDYLGAAVAGQTLVHPDIFTGKSGRPGANGAVEWAVAWSADADGFLSSYCNTIPTADGGTHESGLRTALLRALKDHGERVGQGKRAAPVTSEDVMTGAAATLSVFIREPEFQSQTKDRLATAEAARIVESAVKDQFDHWLAGNPTQANRLLDWVVERADERIRRRQEKEIARKSAGRKSRLPGKLSDCTDTAAEGSEIFIVEGDSAGGSAKQARNRGGAVAVACRRDAAQAAMPFGASLVAAVTGAGGIFVIMAISLLASSAAVYWSRPQK